MMENNEYKHIEQIEAYLSGTLSVDQSKEFENQLSINADLAEDFNAYKASTNIVHSFQLVALKNQMNLDFNNMKNNSNNTNNNNTFSKYKNVIIASGIILLGGIFYLLSIDNNVIQEKDNATIIQSTPQTEQVENATTSDNITENINTQNIIPNNDKPVKEIKPIVKASDNNNTGKVNLLTTVRTDENTDQRNFSNIDGMKSDVTIDLYQVGNDKNTVVALQRKIKTCPGIEISAEMKTSPACISSKDGLITIESSSIKGGTPPYFFAVNQTDEFYKRYNFSNLDAGVYTVFVKDSKNCYSTLGDVEVTSIVCNKIKTINFSPSNGPLNIEVSSTSLSYYVKISKNIKEVVFESSANAGAALSWNGLDAKGNSVEQGLYICTIEYANGQKETSYINIK